MDPRQAFARVLEAGKGARLRAALQNVGDATGRHGDRRYGLDVMRLLERMLACRDYSRAVLQLTHLIYALDAAADRPGGYVEALYRMDRVVPNAFARLLRSARWRRAGFEVEGDALLIRYADGRFVLTASRMVVLAGLLEVLFETVGYAAVDDAVQPLLDGSASMRTASISANTLARALYAFLSEELPPQQQLQKFRSLAAFFETLAEDGEVDIDDEIVFAFWSRYATSAEGDFRSFATVFDDVIAFVRAVQAAENLEIMGRTASLDDTAGGAFAIAQSDPGFAAIRLHDDAAEAPDDLVETALSRAEIRAVAEWQSPLAGLQVEPADRIKFLNKRELGDLTRLMTIGPLALKFAVSILRADVFGADQARITQALRRNLDGAGLRAVVESAGETDYRGRAALYGKCREQLDRSMKAALHILMEATADPKIAVLFANRPSSAWPDPEDFRMTCRRAFMSVARRGFEDEQPSSETLDGLRAGAGALVVALEMLDRWLVALDRLDAAAPDLEAHFEADRPRFVAQFHHIYRTLPT